LFGDLAGRRVAAEEQLGALQALTMQHRRAQPRFGDELGALHAGRGVGECGAGARAEQQRDGKTAGQMRHDDLR
jgi:hypothetical protein